jgi:TolB-like protein/Tfp pilus assembly protein PilF
MRERLDSWKAIAAYLKRDESTVRRWEKEGLPVHRHVHAKKASIYAYTAEIDLWWHRDRARLEAAAVNGPRRRTAWLVAACLTLLLAAGVGWVAFGDRLLERIATPKIPAIAVLPLENLLGDPQQEYFADGITESLITELGRINALRVTSRSSVMAYKGKKKNLEQVARELGVDAVVEGAVAREGDRVRVTAQLIRMRPERQVWAERYERELSSILALQADVARAIAGEVRARLTQPEQVMLAKTPAVHPEAFEAYLKGRFEFNKATAQGHRRAREWFQESIRKDPNFAPAYAGLASAYTWPAPGASATEPPRTVFPRAKAVVLKALELDATLAEAHTALGYIKEAYEWDWEGAERAYRRAIELNPNYATAHHWYALYLTIPRRYEEAFAHIKRAQELDPLSRRVRNGKGWLYLWSGQFDRAIEQSQTMLELEPTFTTAHYHLGLAYLGKGMHKEAIASLRRNIGEFGETTPSLAVLAHALGKSGQTKEALEIIAKLTDRGRNVFVSGYLMAIAHVGVGNNEEAIQWMERAVEQRIQIGGMNRAAEFWLKPLHSDPRYQELRRRARLP